MSFRGVYEFHGMELDEQGDQLVGECPFCGKEGHFYVDDGTGQFQCKVCDSAGNHYRFLQKLHEESLAATTEEMYEELSEERGIPVTKLQEWELAVSTIRGKWIIPARPRTGETLANLYLWDQAGLMPTKGLNHQLIGIHRLAKKHKHIYICEGIWDAMPWEDCIHGFKRKGKKWIRTTIEEQTIGSDSLVVACPGANVFRDQWSYHVKGRSVTFLYHNDHVERNGKMITTGWTGTQKSAEMVANSAEGVNVLRWGEPGYDKELPHGYDLRDSYKQNGPSATLDIVFERIEEFEAETGTVEAQVTLDPIPCTSFAELMEVWKKRYIMSKDMRDVLLASLCVVTSTDLGGDQLWLRVIGPPSCGKTTIAGAIGTCTEYVMLEEVIRGFHSGMQVRKGKADPSLIPKMNGKTFICKEADALLSSPARDKILGELRGIYDQKTTSHYLTGEKKSYNVKTSVIICGTASLRKLNRAELGDRFLDIVMMQEKYDQNALVKMSINNSYNDMFPGHKDDNDLEETLDATVQQTTYGFVKFLRESVKKPIKFPQSTRDKIEALAIYLSHVRSRVGKDHDEMDEDPQPEVATRLSKQLTKLAVCAGLVLGKKEVDEECYQLARRLTFDTGAGKCQRICRALTEDPKQSVESLAKHVGTSTTTIRNCMTDMKTLGMVRRYKKPNQSGVGGAYYDEWELMPVLKKVCKVVFDG